MSSPRKTTFILLFLTLCAAAPVANYWLTQRRENVTPMDLYNVVYSQVGAFRSGDIQSAYSRASLAMQQKFSLGQFAKMIRRDYTDITLAERIEFGLVRQRDQRALIQVFFISHDGSMLPCIYSLIYESGAWKIDGVRMLPIQPGAPPDGEIRA